MKRDLPHIRENDDGATELVDDSESVIHRVTKTGASIVLYLSKLDTRLQSNSEIRDAMLESGMRLNMETISQEIEILIKDEYAIRPSGPRKGACLTTMGSILAAHLRRKIG
jgi:hypothetical protein